MHGTISISPRSQANNPLHFDFKTATQSFAQTNQPKQDSARGFFDSVTEQMNHLQNANSQNGFAIPNGKTQNPVTQSFQPMPKLQSDILLSFNPNDDRLVAKGSARAQPKNPAWPSENANLANVLLNTNPRVAYNTQPVNRVTQMSRTQTTADLLVDQKLRVPTPNVQTLLSTDLNHTYPKNDPVKQQPKEDDNAFYRSRTLNEIQSQPASYMDGFSRAYTFKKKDEPVIKDEDCNSVEPNKRFSIFDNSPRSSHRSINQNQSIHFNNRPKNFEFDIGNPHTLLSNATDNSFGSNYEAQTRPSLRHEKNAMVDFLTAVSNAKAESDSLRQELIQSNSKLKTKESEVNDLKLELFTTKEHKKTLEGKIASLTEEVARQKSENQFLKSNEINLKVQLENSKRNSNCVEHNFKISQLEMENKELREKYSSVRLSLNERSSGGENDEASARILKLEAFIKELKRKNELMEVQLNFN
jgi:hypothetical protein